MGRPKKNASSQPADGTADPGSGIDPVGPESADAESMDSESTPSPPGKSASKRKTSRKASSKPPSPQSADLPDEASWHTTEELLKTLNHELGGLKEYVLADLRGEITTLRSRKLQIETEINRLESDRDRLLNERENVLSNRDQAQQQQWAQQFSQVMAQNLRQELQAQLLGSDNSSQARPEQRLLLLREQIAEMEASLSEAMGGIRQELDRHESDLSQQILRMQSLEQQGEAILGSLLQRIQHSDAHPSVLAAEQKMPPPQLMTHSQTGVEQSAAEQTNVEQNDTNLSPISFTLGSTSTTGIAASLLARTDNESPDEPSPSPADPATPERTVAASMESDSATMTLNEFPADVLFGRPATPSPEPPDEAPESVAQDVPAAPKPPIPPFDSHWVTPPTAAEAVSETPIEEAAPADNDNFSAYPYEQIQAPPDQPSDEQEALNASHREEDGLVVPDPFGPDSSPSDAFIPSPDDPPWASEISSQAPGTERSDGEVSTLSDRQPPNEDGASEVSPVDTAMVATAGDELPGTPITVPATNRATQLPGFISAGLSLFLLALQYCTVHLIFHGAPWFGVERLMQPSWASALLTFWIRMLMVLPFMIVIGQGIYPPLLEEMQELFRSRDRRPLISIILSSLLLFMSQLLLYRAIGISSASVAVGLLFVYPAAVSVFGVGLFKRRISQQTMLTLLPIGLGGLLLLVQSGSSGLNPGIISAVCFALYALIGRLYTRRLNVLTLTVMQFGIAWLFSMPALLFLRNASPANDVGYLAACLVLSLTVFLSYFFNTASLNRLGPAWTSIINGWAPMLVVILSVLLGFGSLTFAQGLGVLLVTLGVTALNLERLQR